MLFLDPQLFLQGPPVPPTEASGSELLQVPSKEMVPGRRQCSRDLKPHETLYWGGLWEVSHGSSLMLESLSTSAGALPVLGTSPSSKAVRTERMRKFSHQT